MANKQIKYTVLGMMSGTSLDGLDLALCTFHFGRNRTDFRILKARTLPYPDSVLRMLKDAYGTSADNLIQAHLKYGTFLGRSARDFLGSDRADLIASHGHTVFHRPDEDYTFQLGYGGAVAQAAQMTTAADFRTRDVLLGGQGAPLVPAGDRELFPEYKACINLGGYSNISIRQENTQPAFDITPCNVLLNRAANLAGQPYDKSGTLAKKGTAIPEFRSELDRLPYNRKPGKQSLSTEWTEKHVIPVFDRYENRPPENLLRTLTEHIADETAGVLNDIPGTQNRALITGGGAKNDFLIELITRRSQCEIAVPDELLIDFKEALIFAYLGAQKLRGEINVFASATGALRDHCSGELFSV